MKKLLNCMTFQKLDPIDPNSVKFIAHHVQYGDEPTQDFHNPDRVTVTKHIVQLAGKFNKLGVHVHTTALEGSCWDCNSFEDLGVPEELLALSDSRFSYYGKYGGSAKHFGAYHAPQKPICLLSGFNFALQLGTGPLRRIQDLNGCIEQTAFDIPEDTRLIVLSDAIASAWKTGSDKDPKLIEKTKQIMINKGAEFRTSDEIFDAIKRYQPAAAMG